MTIEKCSGVYKLLSNSSHFGRRGFLGLGGVALSDALLGSKRGSAALLSDAASPNAWPAADSPRGLPPLKITDVRVIVTRPDDTNYVIVKILTSEPGLYGVGDATFDGTELAVVEFLEKYVTPLLIGRDPEQIEDTWDYLYQAPYWRTGPVQMTALAGIDTALWDIKGKRANMPVYQLLGGRTRTKAITYGKATGSEFAEVEDGVHQVLESGYKCCRAQIMLPGVIWTYRKSGEHRTGSRTEGAELPKVEDFDPSPYVRTLPKLFEHLRAKFGPEVEFLHDVHERLDPDQAARLAHDLEPYRLFFLEDCLRPEYKESFRLIREHSTTPLAMGELFTSVWDCVPLIKEQLIDYIRCDLAHLGGITPARKVAALAEVFEVRTAWHGPGDIAPPTHAANVHVDLSIPNFGIQESFIFPEVTREVLPGSPEFKGGYMYVSDRPGLGCDVNEEVAKKYPYRRAYLPTARRLDDSVQPW